MLSLSFMSFLRWRNVWKGVRPPWSRKTVRMVPRCGWRDDTATVVKVISHSITTDIFIRCWWRRPRMVFWSGSMTKMIKRKETSVVVAKNMASTRSISWRIFMVPEPSKPRRGCDCSWRVHDLYGVKISYMRVFPMLKGIFATLRACQCSTQKSYRCTQFIQFCLCT